MYDDGCHLKKYAPNPAKVKLTPTASKIANLKIVIDKFHFSGHIDQWCRTNCNAQQFEALNQA